ncbi:MAG: hypothetical protein AB1916_08950 [Thermodesulfobacteriota bacterium]
MARNPGYDGSSILGGRVRSACPHHSRLLLDCARDYKRAARQGGNCGCRKSLTTGAKKALRKGVQVFEEGQVKANCRFVQIIDHKNKDYRQQEF